MFEGFGVVQGRVWEDGTPRWEFRYKLYGTKTLNTRGLEPRKLEEKKGKVVTNRQRNTMVKAKQILGVPIQVLGVLIQVLGVLI